MSRKPLIRCSDYYYHITTRANNKEYFPLPISDVWPIFIDSLKEARDKHNLNIACFTLMSNHYHLLVQTPDSNLDKCMHTLNHKFSLKLGKRSGRINQILGSRYYWSLIDTEKYFQTVYRYVYQNPIRAGLAQRIEAYPYNSFNNILTTDELFDESLDTQKLEWINIVDTDLGAQIKRGLKKTTFKPVYLRKVPRDF